MKLPRDITGPERVRVLRRLGLQVRCQEASHIRMLRASVQVTVPNHHPVLPKTLHSVLRQAGMTLEAFLAER